MDRRFCGNLDFAYLRRFAPSSLKFKNCQRQLQKTADSRRKSKIFAGKPHRHLRSVPFSTAIESGKMRETGEHKDELFGSGGSLAGWGSSTWRCGGQNSLFPPLKSERAKGAEKASFRCPNPVGVFYTQFLWKQLVFNQKWRSQGFQLRGAPLGRSKIGGAPLT